MTDKKEIPEAKSLRWVCNQIPDNLGDSNEERMLKAIKEYCKRGADKIEELAKDKEKPITHGCLFSKLRDFIEKVLKQIEEKYLNKTCSEEFQNGAMSIIQIMKDVAEEFNIIIEIKEEDKE